MPITDGIIVGSNNPIAMIGIAEKGFLNVELSVNTEGGHASSPPTETAVGVLSRAVARIEENPMPVHTDGVMNQTFDAISPDMAPVQRIALGNRWLLDSLIAKQLVAKPSTNATLRTTFAPTMISGSPQPNVLPTRATAVINIRILPGDNVLRTLEHIQKAIDDPRVEINIQGQPSEPSKITNADSQSYKLIERTMREIFPDVLVAPAQMIATTDSRHYAQLSEYIYRFRPLWIKPDDIKRFHGIDERISVDNLNQMVKFYIRFMKNVDTL
jgi:carboxypeptidase PM20D1